MTAEKKYIYWFWRRSIPDLKKSKCDKPGTVKNAGNIKMTMTQSDCIPGAFNTHNSVLRWCYTLAWSIACISELGHEAVAQYNFIHYSLDTVVWPGSPPPSELCNYATGKCGPKVILAGKGEEGGSSRMFLRAKLRSGSTHSSLVRLWHTAKCQEHGE